MNNEDRKEFAEQWTAARETYDKTVSTAGLVIAFDALDRFEIKDIRKAITLHLNDTVNGRFPITPPHIVAHIEGASEERAAVAWKKLSSAVTEIGGYRDVVFDDPAIHAIVDNEGGWLRMCSMDDTDFKYLQHRFTKLYTALVSKRIFSYPRLLKGIENSSNAGKTYPDGSPYEAIPPSVVGDQDQARLVFQKGDKKENLITHSADIQTLAKNLLETK